MSEACTRRHMLSSAAALTASLTLPNFLKAASQQAFEFRYLVGSCMYGYLYLGEILPEVHKCGSSHLDIWPKRHGNQREQLTDLGEELFMKMLKKHNVSLGCITQYVLGPFGLQEEM